MSKKKILTAIVAVSLAVIIMLGGTFAWQSINQTALNEIYGSINPGGRLHDDFVDVTSDEDFTRKYNKDVYVENFTSRLDNGVQVYARIRLDEYMEFGYGAGSLNADGTAPSADNKAKSLMPNAKLEDKSSWSTYIFGEDSAFREYWTWDFEGQTVYMPTFNKNGDSLTADINGTFFGDHIEYKVGDTEEDYAVYDADDNTKEEENPVEGTNIRSIKETHSAKNTIDGYVMSMEYWIKKGCEPGDYWVYDTDGWAYWANPILPDTATGLLLDGIERTDVIIDEDWYYAINVVAQFITKDDIGYDKHNPTGFYADGETVSPEALVLLDKIGVEVTYEVDSADALVKALEKGGNIVLTDDITVDTNLVVKANTVLDLGDHTIKNEENIYDVDSDITSLISVQGADTHLTINGGNFVAKEDDCYAVDVRDGATITINGGKFVGNISAVYVYEGTAIINGGDYSILQLESGTNGYSYMLNAYDANFKAGTAVIKVYGGTFHGFDPSAANDGSYMADGYIVTEATVEGKTVYTVSKEPVTE